MDLQSPIDQSPVPKRARRESLEPEGVTTRCRAAKALERAQSPSSPADYPVLMTRSLAATLPVDPPALTTEPFHPYDTIISSPFPRRAAVAAADQNTDTSNVDIAAMELAAMSLESPPERHRVPVSSAPLSLCPSEAAVDPVAFPASVSRTAPLPAVSDAARPGDATVNAYRSCIASSPTR
jgi:hypothetical protein